MKLIDMMHCGDGRCLSGSGSQGIEQGVQVVGRGEQAQPEEQEAQELEYGLVTCNGQRRKG